MHVKKKRLSYTVGSYIDKTLTIPLARVHPGFVFCLCLKVVNSKLTMQILIRAKLHLFFFLCSFCVLKKDFGIYDLVQFLNGLDLHETPELDFTRDEHVVIKEGKMRSKYFFADPNVIITPPDKAIDLPTEDVAFELSTDQLDKLLKAAAIYQLADLAVEGGDGVVKLLVRDKKNDTSNSFSVTVGETDKVFSFNFKVENIKILPGTYNVVVSQKLLSRFTNKNQDLVYFIALEPDSTFG